LISGFTSFPSVEYSIHAAGIYFKRIERLFLQHKLNPENKNLFMQATTLKQSFFRFFLFVGLAAAMVACKKDKDSNGPGPDPVPNSAKLQAYTNGEDYIRFTYNADGTVKKVTVKTDDSNYGDEMDYTVTYNAQKKIASLATDWYKIEVEYQNNVLSRANMYEYNNQIGYTDYVFENGNLKKATIHYGEGGLFVPLMEYVMTYNGQGNLTETLVKMAAGEPGQLLPAGLTTYEYDQKANPLYQYRELLALFWQSPSKNNITVESEFDGDHQLTDKFTYTYTYKSNGLPEKGTVKQGLPGQDPVTSQLTFTYQ
jgi:hypothetical protein